MIKLLDEITNKEITFAETGCLGVRALGPVLAYGLNYDFLSAWAQYDDALNVTALITKFYGAVTVQASRKTNTDEVEKFLEVIGHTGLSDNFHKADNQVMTLKKGELCTASPVTNCNLIENSNYHTIYDIITKCNGVYVPDDFDNWYVDLSHRVRHGSAATYLLEVDKIPVSTLVVLSITENCIFITGVSTLEEYRGKHYAHTLIKAVCDKYKDKTVYLFCKPEKVAFYEKAGFVKGEDKIFTI